MATWEQWLEQARIYTLHGQIGQAILHLEQAVAQGVESAEICKELAWLSHSINEVRAFFNWCHEAIRLAPSDPEPHLMIARVLIAAGRWSEAREALREASRREPDNAATQFEVNSLLGLCSRGD